MRARGFSLLEALVALSLLSLMTLMGWQGLDALQKGQSRAQSHLDETQRLELAIAQWTLDVQQARLPDPDAFKGGTALQWRDQRLWILRRHPRSGWMVVTWRLSPPDGLGVRQWLRSHSPALNSVDEILQWQTSASLSGLWKTRPESAVLSGPTHWSLQFFRQGGWSHPSSDEDKAAASAGGADLIPAQAVRVNLVWDESQALVREVLLWHGGVL